VDVPPVPAESDFDVMSPTEDVAAETLTIAAETPATPPVETLQPQTEVTAATAPLEPQEVPAVISSADAPQIAPIAQPPSEPTAGILESLAFTDEENVDDSVSRYMQHLLARSQPATDDSRLDRSISARSRHDSGSTNSSLMRSVRPDGQTATSTDLSADGAADAIESPSQFGVPALPAGPVHKQDKNAIRAATEKMRQVANQHTLRNVQAANWNRLKTSLKTKSCLAAFAFMLSAGMFVLGYHYKSDFLWLGLSAAGLGVMTWLDLILAIRDARRRTSQLSGHKKKASPPKS
jgi:hypothetical protein